MSPHAYTEDQLVEQPEFPAVGGFSASNLWRMRACFELYREGDIVKRSIGVAA